MKGISTVVNFPAWFHFTHEVRVGEEKSEKYLKIIKMSQAWSVRVPQDVEEPQKNWKLFLSLFSITNQFVELKKRSMYLVKHSALHSEELQIIIKNVSLYSADDTLIGRNSLREVKFSMPIKILT